MMVTHLLDARMRLSVRMMRIYVSPGISINGSDDYLPFPGWKKLRMVLPSRIIIIRSYHFVSAQIAGVQSVL